jgi:mono/diheme cytochrome c family protein
MRRLLIVAVLISACGKNSEPPPPTTGSPNAQPETGPRKTAGKQSQAELMFGTVCATCHGADGSGNGPGAQALTVKPRNYTDAAWQASVTDEQIKEIILKGGAPVGKSPAMPPSPHLESQPEVLDGLVQLIRGFGKKP